MRVVRGLGLKLKTNDFHAEALSFFEFDLVVVLVLVLGASVNGGSEGNGLCCVDAFCGFLFRGHFLYEREGKHIEGAEVSDSAVGHDAVEMLADAGVGGGLDFCRELVWGGFHPGDFKAGFVEEDGSCVVKVAAVEVDFDFRSAGDAGGVGGTDAWGSCLKGACGEDGQCE